MFNRSLIAAVLAASSLAACSGGGAGSSALPITPPSGPVQQAPQSALMTLTVRKSNTVQASSSERRPEYVSPGANSVSIQLISFNGTSYTSQTQPTVFNLGGAGCTNDGTQQTCSLAITNQPVGNDIYQVIAYSQSNAGGSVLSTNSAGISVAAAPAVNTLNIVLNGVVANLVWSPSTLQIPSGVATTYNVALQATDASNYIIVGSAQFTNAANTANVTISASCDTHLALEQSNGNGLSSPFTFTSPTGNSIGKVYYDGVAFTGSPAQALCRATATSGAPEGDLTITNTATGNVGVGISGHARH